jgi:hypothetical protein
MGFRPVTPERGWTGETTLWLYILKEAEVLHAGEQLRPVGGRVVGEVLVGIIDTDPESLRSVEPEWQPTCRAAARGASAWPTSWSRGADGRLPSREVAH